MAEFVATMRNFIEDTLYLFELDPFYWHLREAMGECAWSMCRSPCTWLGLAVDDFAETNRGCGQPLAVVSCAWRRERLQRPLCHRRISTCGTLPRNSHGPKRVPWGTPAGTSNQSDNTPFSFTLCCLLLRKSITQFTTVGFTPRLESFTKV